MLKLLLKVASILLFAFASITAYTQGVTTPRTPSPAAMVSQTIGISTVIVKYSRPSVKGRQIWGALVPYGWNIQSFGTGNSAPWRAGANENTVIQFSHDANVEGQAVPAGSYGLFFVVNKDNTGELIFIQGFQIVGKFFLRSKTRSVESQNTVTYYIKLRNANL